MEDHFGSWIFKILKGLLFYEKLFQPMTKFLLGGHSQMIRTEVSYTSILKEMILLGLTFHPPQYLVATVTYLATIIMPRVFSAGKT